MKLASIVSLALLGALSLAALVTMRDASSAVFGQTSRNLLSNDDDDCDMEATARALFTAFNEGKDVSGFFHPEAMRYLNGRLDDGTSGKPLSHEQVQCFHANHKFEVHVGDVVTNGDDSAMVSGMLRMDREMTGIAASLQFAPGSCKITDESYFFSTTSDFFKRYVAEIGCRCFPVLEDIGACRPQAPDAQMDLAKRTRDCWSYLINDDANRFASCFAPHHDYNVNGMSMRGMVDMSNVGQVQGMLALERIQFEFVSIFVEGYQVHVQGILTQTAKSNGATATVYYFQALDYGTDGKILALSEVYDDHTKQYQALNRAINAVPYTKYWETSAASGLMAFAEQLGFPSDLLDNYDEPNFAVWTSPNRNNHCFSEVILYDEVVRTVGILARDTFAVVTVRFTTTSDSAANARDVSDTVLVDVAKGTISSRAGSLGAALTDLSLAVDVASGAMTVANAKLQYGVRYASMYDSSGALSSAYFNTLASLCAKVK